MEPVLHEKHDSEELKIFVRPLLHLKNLKYYIKQVNGIDINNYPYDQTDLKDVKSGDWVFVTIIYGVQNKYTHWGLDNFLSRHNESIHKLNNILIRDIYNSLLKIKKLLITLNRPDWDILEETAQISIVLYSVKDKMPPTQNSATECNTYYLVKLKNAGYTKAMRMYDSAMEGGWYINYTAKIILPITHWAELPNIDKNDE